MTNVQHIIGEHQEKANSILNGYHAELDRIRDDDRLPPEQDSPYLEDAARYRAVLDRKRERAGIARRQTLEDYRAEIERYHKALGVRETELKKRLFSAPGPEGAATLSRAATATETELGIMLDLAARSGNQELARAVFVAADLRGLGDLLGRYFDEIDAEARGLYAEWSLMPTQEQREHQLESVERIVIEPTSGRLAPRVQTSVY